MTSSLHYEPVEGERLELESEIYRSDDTAQIFGDDSRIPIGLREILFDPRLNPSKRFFCFGAASFLIIILLVVFFFIIGGYIHVQNEIRERAITAKNGLQLLPELSSDGAWVMFLNLKKDTDKYVKEIKEYLDKYEKEQNSRENYTRDCKPDDRPNGRAWCRLPIKTKFIRAGKGCTADDNFGYNSRSPCLLVILKNTINWEPKFESGSRATRDIPFKCAILDTFKFYDEHINVTYYPALEINADFGSFSLNKLPAGSIKDEKGQEISDDYGETLVDMPTLMFMKISLPPTFQHGLVHCALFSSVEGASITNLHSFRGNTELRFDIVA